MSTRRLELSAVALVLTGLSLRLFGLDHGLPFIYDPDEPDFVERAFRILETGDVNPHWFGHPGSTTIYLNALLFAAYGAVARLAGWFPTAASLTAGFHSEPSSFYLLARCLTLAGAAGSLACTWALARRVAGPRFGLFALALLAFAPLHVMLSRAARPDMLMTMLVLASTWYAMAIAERGLWRDYLGAGALLGLAVATKYPALVLCVVIVLAHGLGQVSRGSSLLHQAERLAGAGAATIGGSFAGSPFLFIDARMALADLAAEARSYHLSSASEGFFSALLWYLSDPLSTSLGIAGLMLVLAGSASALHRRDALALIVLCFPLVFLLFISSLPLHWDRWVLPVLPFLCILAALGLRELWTLSARLTTGTAGGLAAVLIAVVTVAPPAAEAVSWTKALATAETRTLAGQWILQHVPPGSAILAEAYTPQLPKGRYRLYTVDGRRIWRLDGGERIYVVPRGVIGTLADSSMVQRAGIEYVVLSNHYDRRLWEKDRYPNDLQVYQEIMNSSELLYEVWPARGRAAGLPVRVYRVRQSTR